MLIAQNNVLKNKALKMRDTHKQFTVPTISLHWIIAIGMIVMLAFGLYLENMPRSPDKGELIGIHKSVGVIILLLAIPRIYWRFLNKFPKPISPLPNWQLKLAAAAHWVLIIGTVLMPISGIIMSVGGGFGLSFFGTELIAKGNKIEVLSQVGHIIHGLGGKLIIIFVLLHIAGAIKHQFIEKDGTISRMFGKKID